MNLKNRFENEKYLNWVKVSLVLIYAKEGLESFTEREVKNFHGKLKSTVTNSCGSSVNEETCAGCLKSDIKRQWNRGIFTCFMNICNHWLRALYSNLISLSVPVEFENVEIALLPQSPWECVKLYMPYGCLEKTAVQEFDLPAFLTLYLNCTHFHKFIANIVLCDEIKEIRNRIMHSGTMEVESEDMKRDVEKIRRLLRDPKHFLNDPNCVQAVQKIDQLMDGALELSLGKDQELAVINMTLRDMEGRVSQLHNKQQRMDENLQTLISDQSAVQGTNQEMRSEMNQLQQDVSKLQNFAEGFSTFLAETALEGVDDRPLTVSKGILATIHTKLVGFDEMLKDHDQKLIQYGEELAEHRESLSRNEQEMVKIKQTSSQHGQTLSEHGQILTEHDRSILKLQEQQQHHTVEQGACKRRLDCIERKIGQTISSEKAQGIPEDVMQNLQQHLINFYKEICLWVQSPVIPEEEVRLEDVHVDPDIHILRERSDHSELKDVQHGKLSELSYKQIFCTDSYRCKQIYVTGDAGSGKSMFCKSLVNDWCEVQSGTIPHHTEESEVVEDKAGYHMYHKRRHVQHMADRLEKKKMNLDLMKEFRFLFYITLRDSISEYHVTEMIRSQILQHDPCLRQLDLQTLLRQEKCLIVLDGLDEWVCQEEKSLAHFMNPGIPGRDRLNKNNVFLTTTRPWKFDVLHLKTSEHDKHVQLCGLSEKSAWLLSSKIVKLLNRCHGGNMDVKDFLELLRHKGLGHFKAVPVILTQLVCLWFDKKGISDSLTQLYCSMLDLILDRAKINLSTESCLATKSVATGPSLPSCFDGKDSCQLYTQLIQCLSKLAFESLFNENKEESLVFPFSKAEPYGISKADIDLCLKCGILSQNKVLGRSSGRLKKLSFLHKKVQEFLAAVYIASCEDLDSVLVKIKSMCFSVDTCLEFSKVVMFMSGIKPELASQLLHHFTVIIGEDSRVKTYREIPNPDMLTSLIEQTQTCFTECVSEVVKNKHNYCNLSPVFEDFVLSRNTVSNDLEELLKHNCRSARSIYINTKDISCDSKEKMVQMLEHLSGMEVLKKLHLVDIDGVVSIAKVLNTITNCSTSITCLVLWQVQLNTMVGLFSPMCQTLKSLRSFRLEHVTFTHEQILGLLNFVSKHSLKDLRLWWLECSDHKYGSQCTCKLDLLQLSDLQTLQLSHMEVDNLQALCKNIRSLVLSLVELTATTWQKFVSSLSETSHSLEVELRWVSISQDEGGIPDLEGDLRKLEKFNITQSQSTGRSFYITFNTV